MGSVQFIFSTPPPRNSPLYMTHNPVDKEAYGRAYDFVNEVGDCAAEVVCEEQASCYDVDFLNGSAGLRNFQCGIEPIRECVAKDGIGQSRDKPGPHKCFR